MGQDLIRSSELRSVTSDVEKFTAAINTFRLKFNCLPGDCLNATSFSGTDSNGCPVGGGATGTCDGNGDGKIDWAPESFRAWQQLGQAGLIPGVYSGISDEGVTGAHSAIGYNVPASRINGVGYLLEYSYYSGDPNIFWATNPPGSTMANRILVGRQRVQATANNGGFISVNEAMLIDQKLDDGNPATGTVTTLSFSIVNEAIVTSCITIGVSLATTFYNTGSNGNQIFCAIVFSGNY